jgi:eukaryotic-like serine/threonine-protein kinase
MARVRRPGEPELSEGMRLLDRYSILDRIGSGGMATIYRAMDDRLDRVVCVKLLRTTIVEGSGSTSGNHAVYKATYTHFLQEALALSKLQHPNTLRIYDFGYLTEARGALSQGGEASGAPFHVSEYLDGGNLESHVRLRGPLPTQEALGILEGVCGAADEAHEHGIIHRDIKPSNILFARVRGELVSKLADFGIAHSDVKKKYAETDGHSESVSTVALFSPRWAAPEQLCGSPEGPRTDVYALGLLTIFMLTGRVLFADEDVRLTFNDRVRGDTLVNARLANVGLSGDVAKALGHAMLARPEDRIATAPEFAQRIREALKVRASNSVAPFPVEVVARPAQMPVIAEPGQLALEVEALDEIGGSPVAQPASERVVAQGTRRIRYVQVHEKLDLSFLDNEGGQVRFRVSLLPSQSPSLNVKGLSCFVARHVPGQKNRPSPAVTVSQDSAIELVSTNRQVLGSVSVSFGQVTPQGRLFLVDGRQLLVTYAEAQQAITLMLSSGNDVVVMCRS